MPSDLYGLYWWTEYGDAGQIGTTAQIGLPADEQIVAAASGFVVSARRLTSGYFARVDLLVRDIRSGALIEEITANVGAPVAAIVGDRVFWAGVDPTSNGDDRSIDGGVWTMQLGSHAEPIAVIPAGEDISSFGSAGRVPFQVSPTGRTIASAVGGFTGRFTDIIDIVGLTTRTRLPGVAVFTLTDEVAIASDEGPTDAPRGFVKALAIETGKVLWRFPKLEDRDKLGVMPIKVAGAAFVGQVDRLVSEDSVVTAFEPASGARRSLLVQSAALPTDIVLRVISSLAGAQHVALGRGGSLSDLLFEAGEGASVLDLKTGDLVRDAFTLDTPWLCYPDYCIRR